LMYVLAMVSTVSAGYMHIRTMVLVFVRLDEDVHGGLSLPLLPVAAGHPAGGQPAPGEAPEYLSGTAHSAGTGRLQGTGHTAST
jgi:hypothetical protein